MLGVRPDVEENTVLIDKINKATDASRQYIRDDNVLALLMATGIASRAIERMLLKYRVPNRDGWSPLLGCGAAPNPTGLPKGSMRRWK